MGSDEKFFCDTEITKVRRIRDCHIKDTSLAVFTSMIELHGHVFQIIEFNSAFQTI